MSNSVPNPTINSISFIGSFPSVEKTPPTELPEFAFIGRSNVGKSSLINYLCNRKDMAKTSGTPGKTQMINLFEADEKWAIADLPGYGYARVSKKKRARWSQMIEQYLLRRQQLLTVFLLIDSRVAPMDADLDKIRWLGEHLIPFAIIFTKADKLKTEEVGGNVSVFLNRLKEDYPTLPNHFITSSSKKSGSEDVLGYVDFVLENQQ